MLIFYLVIVLFFFLFLSYNNYLIFFFFIMSLVFFFVMSKYHFSLCLGLFYFDWYNMMFTFVLILISYLILLFSNWYLFYEPKKNMFILLMSLFIFFMFIFFSFNSLVFMLLSWESIGILSYLLINWWSSRSEASVASQQAVIYNRVSDFFIYLLIFIMFNSGLNLNSSNFFNIFFYLFFLISMMSKSSLFFFHPWLPNAMESPTPVSSLLHSSTMVVASVFLFIRFNMMFNYSLLHFMGLISSITMIYSSICSLMQFDLKKIIAYSTTSQLGFMIMIISFLSSFYSMLFLIFHAFFKSLMFLMSSLFIHESLDMQNINKMNIYNSKISSLIFNFSVLSLMSMPFFSSFFVKDLILENIWSEVMNSFLIFIFFFGCSITISYCIKIMNLNSHFFSKISSMLMMGKNTIWMFILCMFLYMNSFFFNYNILEESFINMSMKVITILIFYVSFFLFFNYKTLGGLIFYNPLIHRFFIYINSYMLFLLLFLEFKWLELRGGKINLQIFYSFKFLIMVLIFFFVSSFFFI